MYRLVKAQANMCNDVQTGQGSGKSVQMMYRLVQGSGKSEQMMYRLVRQSLCCLHIKSIDVDKISDQNLTLFSH